MSWRRQAPGNVHYVAWDVFNEKTSCVDSNDPIDNKSTLVEVMVLVASGPQAITRTNINLVNSRIYAWLDRIYFFI